MVGVRRLARLSDIGLASASGDRVSRLWKMDRAIDDQKLGPAMVRKSVATSLLSAAGIRSDRRG